MHCRTMGKKNNSKFLSSWAFITERSNCLPLLLNSRGTRTLVMRSLYSEGEESFLLETLSLSSPTLKVNSNILLTKPMQTECMYSQGMSFIMLKWGWCRKMEGPTMPTFSSFDNSSLSSSVFRPVAIAVEMFHMFVIVRGFPCLVEEGHTRCFFFSFFFPQVLLNVTDFSCQKAFQCFGLRKFQDMF